MARGPGPAGGPHDRFARPWRWGAVVAAAGCGLAVLASGTRGAWVGAGVFTRVAQRLVVAMAAGIWHNWAWATGATSNRSLIAYDH